MKVKNSKTHPGREAVGVGVPVPIFSAFLPFQSRSNWL